MKSFNVLIKYALKLQKLNPRKKQENTTRTVLLLSESTNFGFKNFMRSERQRR